jgi:hypothetical protein
MSYPTCDHLKADGVYCSSPALRDQRFCYFHLDAHARRVQAASHRLHNEPCRLHMPILDNMHAVQAGLQQVVDALADGRIQNRRAALLLFALQQAATSLNSRPECKGSRPEVEPDEPLRALEVPSLQYQYGLAFDTDFDAQPDNAAAEIDASVALHLDARHRQTQQPSLARNPARPESRNSNDIVATITPEDRKLPCPVRDHDRQAAPGVNLKSPPVSSATAVEDPADAA